MRKNRTKNVGINLATAAIVVYMFGVIVGLVGGSAYLLARALH